MNLKDMKVGQVVTANVYADWADIKNMISKKFGNKHLPSSNSFQTKQRLKMDDFVHLLKPKYPSMKSEVQSDGSFLFTIGDLFFSYDNQDGFVSVN